MPFKGTLGISTVPIHRSQRLRCATHQVVEDWLKNEASRSNEIRGTDLPGLSAQTLLQVRYNGDIVSPVQKLFQWERSSMLSHAARRPLG